MTKEEICKDCMWITELTEDQIKLLERNNCKTKDMLQCCYYPPDVYDYKKISPNRPLINKNDSACTYFVPKMESIGE